MRNKKLWGRLLAAVMCATITLSTPVIAATATEPTQATVQEQKTEETETDKETTEKKATKEAESKEDKTAETKTKKTTEEKKKAVENKEAVTDTEKPAETTDTNTKAVSETTTPEIKADVVPERIATGIVFDGTQDAVYKLKNGTGTNAIKEVTNLGLVTEGGLERPYTSLVEFTPDQFSYNAESGEIIISKNALLEINAGEWKFHPDIKYDVLIKATLENGTTWEKGGVYEGVWTFKYNETPAEVDVMPELIETTVKCDGTQDAVFKLQNGTGEMALKEVTELTFAIDGEIDKDIINWVKLSPIQFRYDAESGEVIIPRRTLLDINADANANGLRFVGGCVMIAGTLENGNRWGSHGIDYTWNLRYDESGLQNEDRPQLTPKTVEFDGTQDIVFQFQNGKNNHKIKEITGVEFYCVTDDIISRFRWGSDSGAISQDLEKGEITIPRERAVAVIYKPQSNFNQVGHTYVVADVTYLAEDGQKYCVDGDWNIKVLEKSTDIVPEYIKELPAGQTSISNTDMQSLVKENETQDVVIKTSNGVVYTFAKGTMKMVDGKDSYDLGAELITDFTKVPNAPFTAEEFAFRVDYNYSGQLPASAQITIPVDAKWNGKTLYYYELTADGAYKYVTEAVVANGVYTIAQNHCSDYVATTKAPEKEDDKPSTPDNSKPDGEKPANPDNSKPDGETPTNPGEEINPNPDDNNNNQVNNGNPVKTPVTGNVQKSPKTGDTAPIAMYFVLGIGSIGALGFFARRRFFN